MSAPAERLTGDEPQDVIERHKDRYRKAIALAGREGGVWWDVACGTGYGTQMLPADVAHGFDKVQAIMWGQVRPLSLRYRITDITQGGWSSEAPDPDVVVSIETLEHLHRADQDAFVAEAANRLKPDGVFVLCCPIGNGPNPANPWHLHEPTKGELMQLLQRHFRDVAIEVESYKSTSGPAVQAYAVARTPRVRAPALSWGLG